MVLQLLNPDYAAACFHVFLRIQLWKKVSIYLLARWIEPGSCDAWGIPLGSGSICSVTHTAGVSPRRTSRREIHQQLINSYFNILSIRYPSLGEGQEKKRNLKPGICISICQTEEEAIGCDRTWLVMRATAPCTLHWIRGGGRGAASLGFLSRRTVRPFSQGLLLQVSSSRCTKHPVYHLHALDHRKVWMVHGELQAHSWQYIYLLQSCWTGTKVPPQVPTISRTSSC